MEIFPYTDGASREVTSGFFDEPLQHHMHDFLRALSQVNDKAGASVCTDLAVAENAEPPERVRARLRAERTGSPYGRTARRARRWFDEALAEHREVLRKAKAQRKAANSILQAQD
jgi:hypothetical protein